MITDDEIKAMRTTIGNGVIEAQKTLERQNYQPEETTLEIFSALLSLAHYVAKVNLCLTDAQFVEACQIVLKEKTKRNQNSK